MAHGTARDCNHWTKPRPQIKSFFGSLCLKTLTLDKKHAAAAFPGVFLQQAPSSAPFTRPTAPNSGTGCCALSCAAMDSHRHLPLRRRLLLLGKPHVQMRENSEERGEVKNQTKQRIQKQLQTLLTYKSQAKN